MGKAVAILQKLGLILIEPLLIIALTIVLTILHYRGLNAGKKNRQ